MRRLAIFTALLAGCTAQLSATPEDAPFDDVCEEPTWSEDPEGASVDALSSISCGERGDTGYTSGRAFGITVVTVDGTPVERDSANAYYVMAQAAARDGVEIRVVSGFRTMAEQRHLYYCYTSCTCNSCNLAASPGWSNHQSGHAFDLNTSARGVLGWLNAHGGSYGFRRTVPSEPWHWEWWGGGPGGGPCGVRDDDGDGSPAGVDCDDHDARRRPGRGETCDGVDNDCNGVVDDGLRRSCGTDVGECVSGTETCSAGAWGACAGAIDPVTEICDRLDNDCDGANDDEQVCEREEALVGPGIYGPTLDTDVTGDGLPDACARGAAGFSCLASSDHGFSQQIAGPMLDGLDVRGAALLRMADVDGDGRSDLCAILDGNLRCWRSSGAGFGDPVIGPAIGRGATSLELADIDGDARVDACMRDAAGLSCWMATGHGFERLVTLSALSDGAGFANVVHHGTLRFGDVDGDGRTDVCARDASGIDCWVGLDGQVTRVRGPRWSDASGFDALSYWSTIRLVDVDDDGASDLCARTPEGFRCALAEVRGDAVSFGAELVGPAMDAGWDEPSVYATLRMGDVDGDGRADVCAREDDGLRCWLFSGHAFDRLVEGPVLDAASGWNDAASYRSIRLADVDGDARADLCARDASALRCWVSEGSGFGRVWIAPAWGDGSGVESAVGVASIRLASSTFVSAPAMTGASGSALGGCSVSAAHGTRTWAILVGAALVLARRRRRQGAKL